MDQIELEDTTADRYLLDAPGASLLIFHSRGCGNCKAARAALPEMNLPVARLCWIDAEDNRGLLERYEVFHLPSLYLVRDGVFYGSIDAQLAGWDIRRQIALALQSMPAELP
ncbi:thioredoxin family protein [Verticiella sediminum]|uniref:Thioredoxin family protein n=1 Tax=Verticiella sediminum TaxID=1247510 RepID=A0A556ASB3_9BURK|nr:thioredoxin family protein [Verticiella sediminum]TSH95827.1 thioredoxin family protein [Verticiella sediminum]